MKKTYILALMLLLVLAACAKPEVAVAKPEPTRTKAPREVPRAEAVKVITTPAPCPITNEEIGMLAQVMTAEAQVVYWGGTKYGVSYQARQAAVGWVALNRLDRGGYGDTLAEVLTRPNQFAYNPDIDPPDELVGLAHDIVERWWAEKLGDPSPGRTIPADYLFFDGDGYENHFRKEYERTGEVWDWSLPDPYGSEVGE